jgi:hypothetical protein
VWQELPFVSEWLRGWYPQDVLKSSFEQRKTWQETYAPKPDSLFAHVQSIPSNFLRSFGIHVGDIAKGALANLIVLENDTPEAWPMLSPLRQLSFGDMSGTLHAHFVQGQLLGTLGYMRQSVLQSEEYKRTVAFASKHLQRVLGACGMI